MTTENDAPTQSGQMPGDTSAADTSASETPHHYVVPAEHALTGARLREVDTSPRLRIGEVSERLGLSSRSIRYYEESGLVTPAGRTTGGFRMYSEFDVQRLLGVMQMKPLGFSLERMGQVLGDLDVLRDDDADHADRMQARARISDLHAEMQEALASLAQRLEIARSFTHRLDEELTELDGSS